GKRRDPASRTMLREAIRRSRATMTPTTSAMTTRPGSPEEIAQLKSLIRAVPDWPKPGILFYDITTLLKDERALARLMDILAARFAGEGIDLVAGIEARGFIFAPALAYRLEAGFVPIRKPNKLPAETVSVRYALEYGSDELAVHRDAIQAGQRVLIMDDLAATGGTAAASAELVEKLGGTVVALAFAIELAFLQPRAKLAGREVFSVLQY
ncbi:MAG: adenine phosphoribosyltransferase, partial [Terriglobales bacterium]